MAAGVGYSRRRSTGGIWRQGLYRNFADRKADFFQNAYLPVLNSDIRPDIITGIRFKLQEIAIAHDQTVDNSEIDGLTDNIPKGE